jgi:hypothetical protein
MQYNREKGEALIELGEKIGDGTIGKALIQWGEDLMSDDPARYNAAAEQLSRASTVLLAVTVPSKVATGGKDAGKAATVNNVENAANATSQAAKGGTGALDLSRISARTGGDAADHVTLNHGSLSLTKPNQGVFYGNPVSTIEDAWAIAQRNGLKPVTVGNRDIYVIPRPNSGYAGGMGGQLENYNHVTVITEAGTSRVVTGYPSGGTPPLELLKNDFKNLFGGE